MCTKLAYISYSGANPAVKKAYSRYDYLRHFKMTVLYDVITTNTYLIIISLLTWKINQLSLDYYTFFHLNSMFHLIPQVKLGEWAIHILLDVTLHALLFTNITPFCDRNSGKLSELPINSLSVICKIEYKFFPHLAQN